MGMFDDIRCKYPLPIDGANGLDYQTKDTESQYCDLYEIREDGTLWHEDYDMEDQSDAAKWKKENPGKEVPEHIDSFCGCGAKVNKRWTPVSPFTGEIRFYTSYGIKNGKMVNVTKHNGWIEWSAYFVGGKASQINLIKNRIPDAKI